LAPRYKNSLGMEFALVPKGKWWAGGFGGNEGTTQTNVAQDFYLGVYEVTQEEWQMITGKNPSHFTRERLGKEIGDDDPKRFPVESVTWAEAKAFVKLVNEKVMKDVTEASWEYRLPTEQQWEYACRGGPMTAKAQSAFLYYFEKPGNTLSKEQANFADSGWNRPRAVGSYPPNRLGLHDMHGNVWEWCEDHYDSKGARVLRGGGWNASAVGCRAARRNPGAPSARNEAVGLRLARVPVGKAAK
jgi:formylglycine-generating enzyme required for sulfatase activity